MYYLLILSVFSPIYCYANDFSVIINRQSYGSTGVVAAFGDFNANRMVDIFVIDQEGDRVDVLFADTDKQFTRHTLINATQSGMGGKITRVMLADFNADRNMDILLVRKQDQSTHIEIYWGNSDKKSVDLWPFLFNMTIKDDPVLFDFNADMLPDLLVESENRERIVWQATTLKSFIKVLNVTATPLAVPHSCAFVNIRGGTEADLVVTSLGSNNNYTYEIYSYGNLSSNPSEVYWFVHPDPTHSSFGDFNRDGVVDHVVQSCSDTNCSIHVHHHECENQWCQLFLTSDLTFYPALSSNFSIPPKLHIGDYDMDGFPDAVVIMSSPFKTSTRQRAYLLHNIECGNDDSCSSYGRKFELQQEELNTSSADALLATFFDFDEDGTLDIAMTVRKSNGSSHSYELVFVKNSLAEDTCFLKVTVISGLCESDCSGNQPYGVNVPGPTVNYTTSSSSGSQQSCSAGQLSQSSHFALQLPYVIFGLGQTPNFVDRVGIGMPRNNSVKFRYREWQQIIPNSQLMVITSPLDDPSSWKLKLFLTPSKQIWLTGIALAATCGLVALIVGGLHLQERQEDNKEKKQESQKFHFDAM